MNKYNLGFISDEDIFSHVLETVSQYNLHLDLATFNKNIIDPIKMTFDAKIYGQTPQELIQAECIRQIDKGNNNKIGYFHQNIFRYAGNGWRVPANGESGFDVVNDERHIFAEVKNKHNTMNSAAASSTYIKMQSKLLADDQAVCHLVEVIATASQDIPWKTSIQQGRRKEHVQHNKIRRISIDKFYALVFNDPFAFAKLCQALPTILDDVVKSSEAKHLDISVYDEMDKTDFYRSLYLLAFGEYEGFDIPVNA